MRMTSGAWRKVFLQRMTEGMGIETDLALRDDGFFMMMDEFDRIFHADDVAGMHGVAMVDHRGQ